MNLQTTIVATRSQCSLDWPQSTRKQEFVTSILITAICLVSVIAVLFVARQSLLIPNRKMNLKGIDKNDF